MKESRAAGYSILTGLAGGALAWSGSEILLRGAAAFPDYRSFTLILGALSGLLLGAVVPTAEGLRQAHKRKIASAVVLGALVGAPAGALGMLAGQTLLSVILDTAGGQFIAEGGASLARLAGWGILGLAVGSASGLRSRSLRRLAAGALGGLIGGLIGGTLTEALGRLLGGYYGRLAGMISWGVLVAFMADRMEARRARGRLTVLAGPLKGRSFPVNQKRMTIAASPRADLTIPGEAAESGGRVGDSTQVVMKKGTVVIESPDPVEVNGKKTENTELRYDDVIKVKGTTMIYEAKR